MNQDSLAGHAATLIKALDFTAELEAIKNEQERQHRRLLLSMIEVLDAFDRLLEGAEIQEGPDSVSRGSVAAIARQLERALAAAGARPFDCLEQTVDLVRCEVLAARETVQAPEDVVVAVLARGYEWNGNLLRQAQVIVTRHPKEKQR